MSPPSPQDSLTLTSTDREPGLLRTPAALGSTMRLIDVPSAFVLQVAFFGQRPHLSSVAGALLIMLCTVGSAYRKWRQGQLPTRAATVRQSFAFGKLCEEERGEGTAPVADGSLPPVQELAIASNAPHPYGRQVSSNSKEGRVQLQRDLQPVAQLTVDWRPHAPQQ